MVTFLLTAAAISLSGVLAPGPMTAATLAAGMRWRHAGAMIALGHGAVEFPLMLVIVAGVGAVFQLEPVKLGIGLAGGLALLLMGAALVWASRNTTGRAEVSDAKNPFLTGVVLSGGNPYFLIWWATVGLALATQAVELGILAFALFALVHWLCDLVWLEALSLASHRGTQLLGGRLQQIVLAVCGLVLLGFAAKFLYDAGRGLLA